MIYVVGVFCVAFIALFCFALDMAIGSVLFYWYYALHLASNRDRFVRVYRYASRTVGVVMISGIIVVLTLRAIEESGR